MLAFCCWNFLILHCTSNPQQPVTTSSCVALHPGPISSLFQLPLLGYPLSYSQSNSLQAATPVCERGQSLLPLSLFDNTVPPSASQHRRPTCSLRLFAKQKSPSKQKLHKNNNTAKITTTTRLHGPPQGTNSLKTATTRQHGPPYRHQFLKIGSHKHPPPSSRACLS